MKRKIALAFLTFALSAALAAPAGAETKPRKQAAKPVAAAQPMSGFRQQPARMIEVQPGVWVSSYGCITDDGYGRRLPCDVTDSSGR
jgi:hypothetical protein